MSARAEQEVQSALREARARRHDLRFAVEEERKATVRFMDEAVSSRWSWDRIGTALGISGTGANRYYRRNRRRVHSV